MSEFTALLLSLLVCGSACSFGAARAMATTDELVLENTHVRLQLRASDFALLQLTDLEDGGRYVLEPGGGLFVVKGLVRGEKPPVWYVSAPGTQVRPADFPRREAQKFTTPAGGAGWKLRYLGAPLTGGRMDVEVSVTLPAAANLLQWEISVSNSSPMPLQEVVFPTLNGLASSREGSAQTDYMAVPLYSGALYRQPRSRISAAQGQSEYPGSGMSVQLLSYCDGQGGALYFASHDADNHRKTFAAAPMASKAAFRAHIIHYPGIAVGPGNWKLPYPVVCGPLRGDWYDAAKAYRHWAVTQPRWRQSLAERTDIPEWFQRLPVWFQGNAWGKEPTAIGGLADKIVRMREHLGYDFGFHWYLWQKYIAHDYNYPDYLPARPGFAEAVAKVRAAGVRVMPYINIHLCETQLPIWTERKLAAAAKLNQAGKLYTQYGIWGAHRAVPDSTQVAGTADVFRGADQKGRRMVPMCPAEVAWQDVMVGAADRLLRDCAVDSIYYDETFVYAGLCFARDHASHPWQGGNYHAKGIEQIHRRTHALRPEGVLTTGENLGECYTDSCVALINAHSDMRPDSLPIFQTVHADRTTEVGVFTNRAEFQSPDVFASKLAFSLTRGRVLGWFNGDQGALDYLVDEKMGVQLEMLKKHCAVRLAGPEFLYAGEMLRAPDLSALPTAKRRWEIWPTFKQKVDYELPVVLGAMFRAPDGSLGLVLSNHTATAQTVRVPWNRRDWGLAVGAGGQRRDFADGEWGESARFTVPATMSLNVAAYSPLLVKISTP